MAQEVEFYHTIKYLDGQKTYHFVRGVAGMVQELTTYHNNPIRGITVNVYDIYF